MEQVVAFAPGRVNLIGDHTDYTGGLCLPMALTMGVTIRGTVGGDRVVLTSDQESVAAVVPMDIDDPSTVEPPWARYVAGVVAEASPLEGLSGTVSSDLPTGAGLSSSAALEVAVALALGAVGSPLEIAALCQRAEHRARGVPCGILDQLSSTSGVVGHALVMDCRETTVEAVPIPESVEFVVVHSGQERTLAGSAYGERRTECEAAETMIGPLRDASLEDVESLRDGVLRRRARHVVSENARVLAVTEALAADDLAAVGEIFAASHSSLRDDFECSTPVVDETVRRLSTIPGVHGVRMTGGGWGGCVVAATDPGTLSEGWRVTPGGPARLL